MNNRLKNVKRLTVQLSRMKISRIFICSITTLLSSCHDSGPKGPNEPPIFTFCPIEKSKLSSILSLGRVQPVGHTLPTDHIYINTFPSTDPLAIYAPGGGVIDKILSRPVSGVPECKVWVKMNSNFTYYLDHIVLHDSMKEGTSIKAGQDIGYHATQLSPTFDMGVIDNSVLQDFANPKRYFDEQLHCGKPLTYYADSLKSFMYSKVDREGSDKDGQVNIDVKGKLVGNWFLDGSTFYTDGPDGYDKELSFAFDVQHPTKVYISIGGTLGLTGLWGIQSNAVSPSEVSINNGKVAYRLMYLDGLTQAGLMIVQMLDSNHIKVEVFPNSQALDSAFDSNAFVYAR